MQLDEIRKEIDQVDDRLTELFAHRMELAKQVAASKKESGKQVADRGREREILYRVTDGMNEEMAGYTRVLYQTLFELSRASQRRRLTNDSALPEKIKLSLEKTDASFPARAVVACQGTEGAYSQQACDRLFQMPKILYFKSFQGVIKAVAEGLCEYGILPIENSIHGSVNQVYDLMEQGGFSIVRSLRLQVRHSLLSKKDVPLSQIKEIISHEQGLGQCSEFLASLPGVKITSFDNTAEAAKFVAQSDRDDLAVICSDQCAEIYNLHRLAEGIQDSDNNFTRFICISRKMEIYAGANRISLLCSLPHTPGALYELVAKFNALGLNLVKLESRPIPGRSFEFHFYLDFEADVRNEATLSLLAEMDASPERFCFFGAYQELS